MRRTNTLFPLFLATILHLAAPFPCAPTRKPINNILFSSKEYFPSHPPPDNPKNTNNQTYPTATPKLKKLHDQGGQDDDLDATALAVWAEAFGLDAQTLAALPKDASPPPVRSVASNSSTPTPKYNKRYTFSKPLVQVPPAKKNNPQAPAAPATTPTPRRRFAGHDTRFPIPGIHPELDQQQIQENQRIVAAVARTFASLQELHRLMAEKKKKLSFGDVAPTTPKPLQTPLKKPTVDPHDELWREFLQ